MSDTNLPPPADPVRAVLLLSLEALALQSAALDEASGLLPELHRDRVQSSLHQVDATLAELRHRVDPGRYPDPGRGAT
jgi:hypothetical protein